MSTDGKRGIGKRHHNQPTRSPVTRCPRCCADVFEAIDGDGNFRMLDDETNARGRYELMVEDTKTGFWYAVKRELGGDGLRADHLLRCAASPRDKKHRVRDVTLREKNVAGH